MGKVVGVGGIFLKAQDPKALKAWYVEHLGLPVNERGISIFDGAISPGKTVFELFPETAAHLGDEKQRSMINFRVDSLEEVLAQVTAAGVRVEPMQDFATYGKFAWFWDPDGNRVELWEPSANT